MLTGASEGRARNPWHRKLLAKNCTFLSAPSGSWWCFGYVAVIPLAHTNIALKERLREQRVDHFVSQQTTKSA